MKTRWIKTIFEDDNSLISRGSIQVPEASDFGSPIPIPIPVPPIIYICDKCGLSFTSQTSLDAHKASDHPVTPPVAGKWATTLAGGLKLNTRITDNGVAKLGWGCYLNYTPPQVSVGPGGTLYFVIDPNTYTGLNWVGRTIKIRAIDYDQSNTGSDISKRTQARLITVDRAGNELLNQNLASDAYQFTGSIYYGGPEKIYIIEVKQGDLRGARFSAWWP